MASVKEVILECKKCGAEIIIKETDETVLAPVYCCGAKAVGVRRDKTKLKKQRQDSGKKRQKYTTKN